MLFPTSNAFSSWTGFDYEDQKVPEMSSSSQHSPQSAKAHKTDTYAGPKARLSEQLSSAIDYPVGRTGQPPRSAVHFFNKIRQKLSYALSARAI